MQMWLGTRMLSRISAINERRAGHGVESNTPDCICSKETDRSADPTSPALRDYTSTRIYEHPRPLPSACCRR